MKKNALGRVLTRSEAKTLVGGFFTPECGDGCSANVKCPSQGKCSSCKSGKCVEKKDEEEVDQ